MAKWAEFAKMAPTLAAAGRRLIERSGTGTGLLATVRDDAPRIHPIYVAIVEGRLLAFVIVGSAKVADLGVRRSLRPARAPGPGRSARVPGSWPRPRGPRDRELRTAAAAAWSFEVDDGYRLFEFGVEHAVFGERGNPDAWPPSLHVLAEPYAQFIAPGLTNWAWRTPMLAGLDRQVATCLSSRP